VRVVDYIQDDVFIVAQNNELFARVPLSGQLNEDTDAGQCHWPLQSARLPLTFAGCK